MASNKSPYRIHVSQLRPGVYIRFEQGWLDHAFTFNSFKIKNQQQIKEIRASGIKYVIYVPEKSDVEPISIEQKQPATATVSTTPASAPQSPTNEEANALWQQKKERIERLIKQKEKINECQKRYEKASGSVRNIMQNIFTRPEQAVDAADELIKELATSFTADKDVVVHLMASKGADDSVYYHSLNVAVLSMMLAKERGIENLSMRMLGLGALLHDIGKGKIPDKITRSQEPLTGPELHFLQLHPGYGVDMAKSVGNLPKEVIDIIGSHHERIDGKGYPKGLSGTQISELTKIVSITNIYDNYCNAINPKDSLTPSEALALMFKQQGEFDPALLKLFIRCLGVYPPGTIVQLTNDMIGMVVSVKPEDLLHPSILLYDPDIPKDEAIIIDISEDQELNIARSLRPSKLPSEVYDYLSPRTRVSYFFESSNKDQKPKK